MLAVTVMELVKNFVTRPAKNQITCRSTSLASDRFTSFDENFSAMLLIFEINTTYK